MMKNEDVIVFKEALLGEGNYNKEHPSIIKVESFLIEWLKDQENRQEMMQEIELLYREFLKEYAFSGTLYRGMVIPKEHYKEKGLVSIPIASYTDSKEIGLYFAGKSKEYGMSAEPNSIHLLAEISVSKAFHFDDFLAKLSEVTDNPDLLDQIDERIWEQEKLYLFDATEVSLLTL